MLENIFEETAPLFWDAGYKAIPARKNSKAPAIKDYPRYKGQMPSQKEMDNWRHNWPDGNINVVLGGGGEGEYVLAVLDTDGADHYVRLAEAVIGQETCRKVGARGRVDFVLVPADLKTLHIKNCENEGVYDVLTDGAVIAVPPSIHPETKQPHRWLSRPLYEYKQEELPRLSKEKIEFLETVPSMAAHLDLVNGGPTHVAARDIDWYTAHLVDEDTFYAAMMALLPEGYDGDIEEQLRPLYRTAKEKKDKVDAAFFGKKKGSPTTILLTLVESEKGIEIFSGPFQTPYISFREDGKGPIAYPLSSDFAALKLKRLYYQAQNKPIPKDSYTQVYETLCARALFDSPQKEVVNRIGRFQESVLINLADENGSVVLIDASAAVVTTEPPLVCAKPEGILPLSIPTTPAGSEFQEFQKITGLELDNFCRLIVFLVSSLKPEGPYFLLILEGEQGSGKSFLCTLIKSLIDPNEAPKLTLPDGVRNLMILAKHVHLLVFDNVSWIKAEMSDALCSLSTGGGYAVRKNYKDDSLQFFKECRPYILNGITGIANRPDLLDRAISINLPTMPEGQRKTESQMRKEFDDLRPRLQAKLYELVSCAIKNFDSVETPTSVRMADATKWVVAAEPATGLPPGTLLRVLEASQREIVVERMSSNSIAIALNNLVERGPWFGRVGDLFNHLKSNDNLRFDQSIPKTSTHFSKELDRLRPALEKAGIMVEIGKKDRTGRQVAVWLAEHADSVESARKIYEDIIDKRGY